MSYQKGKSMDIFYKLINSPNISIFLKDEDDKTPLMILKDTVDNKVYNKIKKIILNKLRNNAMHRKINNSTNECIICYEKIKTGIITKCNHYYCNNCIDNWLLINQNCPFCRCNFN